MSDNGIVYILTNPCMPGMVKIGRTSREIDYRLNELYSTGVPLPFECEYAARVEDENRVERAFHLAFAPYRINQRREFFKIEPDQAIQLLRLVTLEDVTPSVQAAAENVDQEARASAEIFKSSRRKSMRFSDIGIEPGTQITFIDGETTCTVINDRQVEYNGTEWTLSGLAQDLLQHHRSVRGSAYFLHNGRKLSDIYDEINEEQ